MEEEKEKPIMQYVRGIYEVRTTLFFFHSARIVGFTLDREARVVSRWPGWSVELAHFIR